MRFVFCSRCARLSSMKFTCGWLRPFGPGVHFSDDIVLPVPSDGAYRGCAIAEIAYLLHGCRTLRSATDFFAQKGEFHSMDMPSHESLFSGLAMPIRLGD